MIRINLLAQRKRVKAAGQVASQAWLVVVLVALLVEVVGLFIFHSMKLEELAEQEQKNRAVQNEIEHSRQSVANHEAVKARLGLLRAREAAIAKLNSARTGPTAVLLEFARILTPGRGPSVNPERLNQLRRDNPLAAMNSSWDPRRLWILSFREENRKVRIDGLARDGEDVSELARRMNLSDYFTNVALLPAHRETDPATKLELVRFSLEAGVKY
jgi:type IV pilus assembly protein PilN